MGGKAGDVRMLFTAALCVPVVAGLSLLPTIRTLRHRDPHVNVNPVFRRCPTYLMECDSAGEPESTEGSSGDAPDFTFSALREEIQRRDGDVLTKSDSLRKLGPQPMTSPKEVVEHVIRELGVGNLSQAFLFTCMPPWRQGTHKSTTDWRQRMAWDRSKVINGQPSGKTLDHEGFTEMVRKSYGHTLLETQQLRFVGDTSPWQQKQGQEKMTADKTYIVELQTRGGEHFLVNFYLVYDWLVACHLIATVSVVTSSLSRHFPGADDQSFLDI